MTDGREAEVLISIDTGKIAEVHGAERVIVAKGVEIMIVSITPTVEEVNHANEQLKLPPGTLAADGRPLVFVLAGEYKIPVTSNIPAVQESSHRFVFTVPNLWMEVTLGDDNDEETCEAFAMLLKTYGSLRVESNAAPPSSGPSGGEQSRDLPAGYPGAATPGAYGQPPAGYPTGEGSAYTQPPGGGEPSPYPAGAVATTTTAGGYPDGTVATQGDGKKISTKVAGGVTFVAKGLIKGIRKGRDVAVGGLQKGSHKVIEKTDACEQPVHVPTEYKAHMAKARATTKSAVVLTGTVTAALVGVSAVLGSGAAGVVGKVIPKGGGPISNSKAFEGVKEVGGAVVGGAATVFVEATDAARVVLTAGCEGISDVVEHKFGSEVGGMTSDGLGLVTDSVTVAQNVRNVGVKAVAKNAAKHMGSELMDDMNNDGTNPPPPPPPAGYPQAPAGYPSQ